MTAEQFNTFATSASVILLFTTLLQVQPYCKQSNRHHWDSMASIISSITHQNWRHG